MGPGMPTQSWKCHLYTSFSPSIISLIVSINLTNVSTSIELLLTDGTRHYTTYITGTLIPPDKHNATGLRDLMVDAVMEDGYGRYLCRSLRLGGKGLNYDRRQT